MIKKAALVLVSFLSVAAVIGIVATRSGSGDAGPAPAAERAPQTGELEALDAETAGAGGGEVGAVYAEQPASDQAELPGLPPLGQAVVKTAELTVEVAEGTFADAFDTAALVASRFGGYVEASTMAGAEGKTGTLTLRVPSGRFDDAMSELRALGVVKGESMSGQVVTQEFIDLEARLTTWRSQEAVLLSLMEEATTVDATLRIQRELQEVQFRIEQIQGQLRVLEDQTALATIHVTMREPGVPIALEEPASTRPSLAEAWERAVDGLLEVAYVTIVGLGYLIPLTLLALLAWVVVRRVTRREAVPPAAA
jgi:hypothetical protein